MRALFRKLRALRFRHEVLIEIVVHRDCLLHNLAQFRTAHPGIAVAPVLKSNAYGHGLIQTAKILASAGPAIPFFCVDSYAEALILRNEGIRTPILVIGYTPLGNMERNSLRDIAFGVMSMEELRRLVGADRGPRRRPVTIHLKIDTGMHRQGILPEELGEALGLIARTQAVVLQGAYSHLADADAPESALTETQIRRWNATARTIKAWAAKEGMPPIRYFHLANTAGSSRTAEIDANAMRPGIGLYGVASSPDRGLRLLPALEMRTRITSVRKIATGEHVGYNATFTARREMTVATIPVGYAEGIDRRLSNKGTVLVQGIPCPIVGRVNMNITSVDVTNIPEAKLDDEVLAVSAEPGAPNSIENMAKLCAASPYELLVHLPDRIRRTVRS